MTRHTFFATAIALLLLTTATTPCHSQEQKPEIKVEYNRFDDNRIVRLRPMKIVETGTETLLLSASFVTKGEAPRATDEADIHFTSLSDSWRYTADRSLILLLDGERLSLPTILYEQQVMSQSAVESMSVQVSYDTLSRIANAKKVEGRLGRREFILPKGVLEGLQELARRMKQPQ
jgi:hypothetical protein